MTDFSEIPCPLCRVNYLPYYKVEWSRGVISQVTIVKPFCDSCIKKLRKIIKDVI